MAFFEIDANKPFPSPPIPQAISAGVVYEATAKYVLQAGAAAGNVIPMVPVPARARVVDVIVAATGQATTLSVGDGDDDDRYVTSGAVAAGAIVRLNSGVSRDYNYPTGDTIDIKLGGTPVAGGVVLLTVQYVQE